MQRKAKFALSVAHLALFFVAAYSFSPAAMGHSFYPTYCCSGHDCAPIKEMSRLPDGSLVITNENGDTAIFPKGFEIKAPQDDKEHACISKYGKQPLCLFLHARI